MSFEIWERGRSGPDGVGAAAAAQGEVDAGEEGELTAVVVGFEDG